LLNGGNHVSPVLPPSSPAGEPFAVVHDIPKVSRPIERKKLLSKGHPHLRVSALAKRYGWGFHNNAEGKIAPYRCHPSVSR
jgi:hypothetical protein